MDIDPLFYQMREEIAQVFSANRKGLPLDCLATFISHLCPHPATGCWTWSLSGDGQGYGVVYYQRPGLKSLYKTHRLAYEIAVGPIPVGYHIHHKCCVRLCCNPAHLEALEPAKHRMEEIKMGNMRLLTTHCKQGHPFEGNDPIISNGKRRCRICANELRRQHYAAMRSANPLPERTHCIHGHELNEANSYVYKGKVACRECRKQTVYKKRGEQAKHFEANPENMQEIRPADDRCSYGHIYAETGFYVRNYGAIRCAECERINANARNARKRKAGTT